MINLPYKEVAKAALKAYEEGRLSAQGPTPQCQYRDESGCPCAIGAAISDEDFNTYIKDKTYHNNNWGTDTKLNDSGISGPGLDYLIISDNRAALIEMQNAHDAWCGWLDPKMNNNQDYSREAAESENEFYDLVKAYAQN